MRRLRMVAGPNGSGKSTLIRYLRETFPEHFLGPYVNADDLKRQLEAGDVSLEDYGLTATLDDVARALHDHPLVHKSGKPLGLHGEGSRVGFDHPTTYHAAAFADYLRRTLLATGETFAFETVMSHASKVAFLDKARAHGYRVYLYFIATGDARLNVERVGQRVRGGGHDVPAHKIIERYTKTMELLRPALRASDRAYLFDNSGTKRVYLADVTEGSLITLHAESVPDWFVRYVGLPPGDAKKQEG